MKAVLARAYGSPDVLTLEDVDPPEVADDAVLVRVRAASINALDWHRMRGEPFLVRMSGGFRRPKDVSFGTDLAGTVEAVGREVTDLRPGDDVFGVRTGALAEYVSGRTIALKPTNLSFEEAAGVPVGGTTALQALRDKGQVRPGQRVLVNGASGSVGPFAVQIAKAFGAIVTAVCSPANVEQSRSLGADRVVDYTREDFTTLGQRYDLIVDIAGNRSFASCRRVLASHGALVVVGGPGGRWIKPADRAAKAAVLSRFGGPRLMPFLSHASKDDLLVLKELIEAGKVRPVIDRTYPLAEVAEAVRYVETGHARAKVIVTL
jgi:NADPH:quinone reductase-like Zn-dependent oxidoreductase